jgi:hypothetical protein
MRLDFWFVFEREFKRLLIFDKSIAIIVNLLIVK